MDQPDRTGLDRFLSLTFGLWLGATLTFVATNAVLVAIKGPYVFSTLVQVGPVSGLKLTYSALGLVWLSSGLLLALLCSPGFRARHGLTALCCFVTLVLYANVLRERMEYPDAGDYMRAAFDLAEGRPLHERYIYPPLLAAACELLVPLGRGGLRVALWIANVLAVAAFPGLLSLALARYGFDRRLASGLALAFVAINVPVLRTLVYGQVNLHVANLILLALLLQPRVPIGSALALALAVHLKTSPIVLVLPFVTGRSWRWLAAFGFWICAVAGAIYAAHGAQPFVDFVHNTRGVYQWSDLSFRENSVDSLLRSTSALLGGAFAFLGAPVVRHLALGAVALATLAVAGVAIGRGAWASGRGALSDVLNGWPALSLLMVLASPLVWEHHPVFAALPFLLVTRRLQSPVEWALWSLAYGVVYLLPTFDFYPWSFGRLAGMLLLVVLLHRSSTRSEDGAVFRLAQERIGRFDVLTQRAASGPDGASWSRLRT
jgi:hypothetical protein